MTGIHNKRFFMEFLEREIAVASRHGHPLTLVMFDVDHFKKVNDTHGHLAGDAVLKDLSQRIRPRIRREDLFARYGGEEFACVPAVDRVARRHRVRRASAHADRRAAVCVRSRRIPFTISVGVTTLHREGGVDPTGLIKRADENLYAAKRGGRNRVVPSLADLILSSSASLIPRRVAEQRAEDARRPRLADACRPLGEALRDEARVRRSCAAMRCSIRSTRRANAQKISEARELAARDAALPLGSISDIATRSRACAKPRHSTHPSSLRSRQRDVHSRGCASICASTPTRHLGSRSAVT